MAEICRWVRSRAARVPRGLLGMLALVALLEGLIRQVEPAINGVEPWDWRRTGLAATESPEVRGASVLCFGDSLVKLGVQPQILQAKLEGGRTAYNLALCAGRAPATNFLLRRALQAGARPEALIVDFNDSFLAESPATTLRLYSEFLRPGETRELARGMARPDFASAVFALQVLPSARNRFEIRRALRELGQGRADFAGRQANAVRLRRNWEANLGGQVTPKVAVPFPTDPSAWHWIQPAGWTADPTNVAHLLAFFERAEAHQIPVFWLLPPLHPGYSARRAELGLDAPFDAFVAQVVARFSRVVVVDGRGAKYDPSMFIDMAHLDRDGSTRLSVDLAAVLAENLARPGPRLVALPRFASPVVVGIRGRSPVDDRFTLTAAAE